MRIALIGAPGSGKTIVGRRLVQRLNKLGDERWALIDGYVEKLIERTGYAFGASGVAAPYPLNLQIVTERLALEQAHTLKDISTITCGSIYESIVYTGILGTFQEGNESQRVENYQVAQAFMSTMGYMESMTFQYDALFILPLAQEQAAEHTWDAVVNAKIAEVLDGLFKRAVILNGTPKEKVLSALQIIETIRSYHRQSADEPTV